MALMKQARRAVRKIWRRNPVRYSYSNFSIMLPGDHLLPRYQRDHGQYDRFLPHLARCLSPGDLVVDVGANCGDTLAAMIDANPELSFLCVEPDDEFFSYLERNVAAVRRAVPSVEVALCKALVGKEVVAASLEGAGGTKQAVASADSRLTSRQLDQILSEQSAQRVRLLKSDVDGFDFDVLNSAVQTIKHAHPLIFFECQVGNASQGNGFSNCIRSIAELGYNRWDVFDNFGNHMLTTANVGHIDDILAYVWRQRQPTVTRTVFYIDLLASSSKDEVNISEVIAGYNRKWS